MDQPIPKRRSQDVSRVVAHRPPRFELVLKVLIIVVVGAFVLSPTLRNPWGGDDDMYLTANPLLNDPHRLWKAWFQPGSFIEYYPVEQTVQWIQWRIWGLASPFPYLACNLALHLTSALLIWHLLSKLGLKLAWLGGLIFAIHPLMVDSVGVSSELKNTLSLPPFLLAMSFYLDFEASRKSHYYLLSLLLFFIAMYCKITMEFFPLMILLYAWWKRGRITGRDAMAAAPFLVISVVLVFITIHVGATYAEATHYQSPGPIHLGGFFERIALAGLSLGFYFGHCFFPPHEMPAYPLWKMEPLTLWLFAPWMGIVGLFAWCWANRRSWGRPALFGLSFFILGLAPFLGLNQVSYMCLFWVQDHFVYIPIIGLIGLFVAGLEHGGAQIPKKFLFLARVILVVALGLLGFQTYSYATLNSDLDQLLRYNLGYNPHMWLLEYQLGARLANEGNIDESLHWLQDSVRDNPDFCNAYLDLGVSLARAGRQSEAIDAFEEAVRVNPNFDAGRQYLIEVLLPAGRLAEAFGQMEIFLQNQPDSVWGHFTFGCALAQERQFPKAISELEIAQQLDPTSEAIYQQLMQVEEMARNAAAFQPAKSEDVSDKSSAPGARSKDKSKKHSRPER